MTREEEIEKLKRLQGWEIYYEKIYNKTGRKIYVIRLAEIFIEIRDLKDVLGITEQENENKRFTEENIKRVEKFKQEDETNSKEDRTYLKKLLDMSDKLLDRP